MHVYILVTLILVSVITLFDAIHLLGPHKDDVELGMRVSALFHAIPLVAAIVALSMAL